jgi:uncharacterized protein
MLGAGLNPLAGPRLKRKKPSRAGGKIMNSETLAQAVALVEKVGHVFIATANASGRTHLAAARTLCYIPPDQVIVSDWFCPETVKNLHSNRFLSIVAWEAENDFGYQIQGQLKAIKDLEMLNGYSPDLERKPPIPQVDRELLVLVEKVIEFKIRPHSDQEE